VGEEVWGEPLTTYVRDVLNLSTIRFPIVKSHFQQEVHEKFRKAQADLDDLEKSMQDLWFRAIGRLTVLILPLTAFVSTSYIRGS